MSTFHDALPLADGTATFPASWAQGRAVFGGLVAAAGVSATRPAVAGGRPLRSVLVDFLAPIEPGPARVEARVVREGRALTHGEARVIQGETVGATILTTWAAARPSDVRVPGPPLPDVPPPEALPPMPRLPGVPAFTRHFDYRFSEGAPPYSGSAATTIGGWCRLAEPTALDDVGAVALADAWPAPVLPLFKAPAPSSTVTWTLDLVGPLVGDPGAWHYFRSATVVAGEGLVVADAWLWGPGGLVAVARQRVAEFSR